MSTDTPSQDPVLTEAELALVRLTQALQSEPSPAAAAQILHQVLDSDTGLLIRVQEIVQAAAEWARESEPDQGDPRFDAVHDALDEISEELFAFAAAAHRRALPDAVRALGRAPATSVDRARAARLRSPARAALQGREQPSPTADPHVANVAFEYRNPGRS